MKIFKTVLATGIVLASFQASASIESDIIAKKSMKVIFDNAVTNKTGIPETFNQIAKTDAKLTPAATTYAACNKLDSNLAILNAAFSAVDPTSDLVGAISDAARKCGASEEDLLGSALANNIDPTAIGEATAAGGPLPGAGGAAGATGAPVSAPSFGSAGGSGGGGTASAG
ncbi:MAG: hypothetical protein OFPII_43640 [Osedax symbiont Rs1]|nr:MAG: hypothetical protein OFPII_43640 [Osedax symbiont Rs1]